SHSGPRRCLPLICSRNRPGGAQAGNKPSLLRLPEGGLRTLRPPAPRTGPPRWQDCMTTPSEYAFDRVCRAVEERTGRPVRGGGANRMAICPAHDDNDPSLSITRSHDRALVNCQAGCDIDAILTEIGLTRADLFDQPAQAAEKPGKPVLV